MTITIHPLTALAAAYLLVGAYYMGASRVHGELQWLRIHQSGADVRGECLPRYFYDWVQPLEWLLLWLPRLAIADLRNARRKSK